MMNEKLVAYYHQFKFLVCWDK